MLVLRDYDCVLDLVHLKCRYRSSCFSGMAASPWMTLSPTVISCRSRRMVMLRAQLKHRRSLLLLLTSRISRPAGASLPP